MSTTSQAGAAAKAPAPPTPIPLPPGFPEGQNPFTYQIEKVAELLKRAAYFPIFNVANPAVPNEPLLLITDVDFLLIGVKVNEELHRFEVDVTQAGGSLKGSKKVGSPVAKVHIRWTPIPDDFQAAPGRYPQPTLLNPFVSQRFCMLDGALQFKDAAQSGVHAFGTGRTFPARENGQSVLRIGAIIEVLEGLGNFQGLTGAMVINGYLTPPHGLALNLVIRLIDPENKLLLKGPVPPLQPVPDPDPNAVFMFFTGEGNPASPPKPKLGPDGRPIATEINELLRLVHIGFDPSGPLSKTEAGPVVGVMTATMYANPMDPRQVSPIYTTDGLFTFFDKDNKPIGTINASMFEGRAMRTEFPGTVTPPFRIVGFGPIEGGTGYFQGAEGMLTINSIITILPQAASSLYVFRFYDPEGRFRDLATRV